MNPSRGAGLQRLESFIPDAGSHYRQNRNYDFGPDKRNNVSLLSPWLRRRILLESEVLAAVIGVHGRAAAEKFIDEILWRAYFRGWLAHRVSVWHDYGKAVKRHSLHLETDSELFSRWRAAEQGATGNSAFDSWARELVETGYLHNHARMWFASIWVFTLRLPWVLGADFFLRHLLDGDPASNTLSWRWVSGLHTVGKAYLANRDNILKYTDGRLDPGPGLALTAVIPDDECMPAGPELCLPGDKGIRSVPAERSAWLLSDEDATPPVWFPSGHPVFAIQSTSGLSPGRVSTAVEAFARQGLEEALARHDGGAGVIDGRQNAEALVGRLNDQGVRDLHCYYVPYGPTADVLVHLQSRLAQDSIQLHQHVRQYDRSAWPLADRGFFRLKRHIPRLLETITA